MLGRLFLALAQHWLQYLWPASLSLVSIGAIIDNVAMHTLNCQQSRTVDRIAIEQYGFSGLVLMENAGRGVVDILMRVDPLLSDCDQVVTILCGRGNNAGDGFVIARHLEIYGARARVVLLAPPAELQGDALTNYRILTHTSVPILDLSNFTDVRQALEEKVPESRWAIDAMLGTGAQGKPREPFAAAIDWMNGQPTRRLAIDVPSGLDCDTGLASSPTVRAEHTCTFVAAKQGFTSRSASEYLGQLHVVSIGIPASLLSSILGD